MSSSDKKRKEKSGTAVTEEPVKQHKKNSKHVPAVAVVSEPLENTPAVSESVAVVSKPLENLVSETAEPVPDIVSDQTVETQKELPDETQDMEELPTETQAMEELPAETQEMEELPVQSQHAGLEELLMADSTQQ